jgi:MYXO-CTERM domain-containing protein
LDRLGQLQILIGKASYLDGYLGHVLGAMLDRFLQVNLEASRGVAEKTCTEANQGNKGGVRKRSRLRANGSCAPAAESGPLGGQALPAALALAALASVRRRGHSPRTPANAA